MCLLFTRRKILRTPLSDINMTYEGGANIARWFELQNAISTVQKHFCEKHMVWITRSE